jgi:uncharacterized membrane protein YkoI
MLGSGELRMMAGHRRAEGDDPEENMKKTLVVIIAVLIAVVAFGKTTKTKMKPKLTKEQAQTIALTKASGGTVESSELEREKGHLVWSFDIRTSPTDITEVLVDANDGSIVDVSHETAAQQKAEKEKEAKEKKGKKH